MTDEGWRDNFARDVEGQRIAVLCPLAPKPILLDVLYVDEATRMMKVKAVQPGNPDIREWWLSLSAIVTVAVVPKEMPLVQTPPSGIVLT